MAKAIVPVAIIALVAVDKEPRKVVKELTPEEVEKVSKCIKEFFLKGDAKIAVYPKAVSIDKVENAVTEFVKLVSKSTTPH